MTISNTDVYFNENALAWITDGYEAAGYTYPTPAQRLRILNETLDRYGTDIKTAYDIGCGGGHLTAAMAQRDIKVTSLDASTPMLELAKQRIMSLPDNQRKNVTLEHGLFFDLPDHTKDCLVALGLIGYLPSDADFFEKADRLVKKDGYVIVSFRNRLFNLFSMTWRTFEEAKNGSIGSLIEEAASYYHSLPYETTHQFYIALQKAVLAAMSIPKESARQVQGVQYKGSIEPRQTSPREAKSVAEQFGFIPLECIGIHPHFSLPALNTCLEPGAYNLLSDALLPFERLPIALLWSSVFIYVFKKK